jgi:hypothetical protein
MRASSSGDHLLCLFAGDSDVCGGKLRFPPPLPGRPPPDDRAAADCPDPDTAGTLCLLGPGPAPARLGRGDNGAGGGAPGVAVTVVVAGAAEDGGCWVGETGDSFESELLRSDAISTMATVSPGGA